MGATRNSIRPYVWMLLGSLSFAVMGTMAHKLGPHCDWPVIALVRALVPLVIVMAVALGSGVRLVLWKPRTLWIRSVAGSVSMVCTFFALTRLPVSDVFTLSNMFPIWVALLSWPLLRQRPSSQVWLSVACGIAGVVLIQQPHLAEGNYVVVVVFISSMFTAIAMIGLHRIQGVDVRAIIVHFSAVSLLFAVAAWLVFGHSEGTTFGLDGHAVAMLLGVGVAATMGQFMLTKAFAAGMPAKVAVVGLTQIVFAMILDRLLFAHSFNSATLVGTALVVAPTAWLMIPRV